MAIIRLKKPNKTPPDETESASPPEEDTGFTQERTPEERMLAARDFRRMAFTLASAVILFAAAIVVWFYRDSFSPDKLILSADTAAVAKEEYLLESGSGQVFAAAGHGLAAASASSLALIDENGQLAVSHMFQMSTPAVAACADHAVFYDIGGTAMAAAFFDGSVKELTPAGNIISAAMSSGGYLAVTTDCTGYRALVTVYDPKLEPVYEWYSSSAWVISGEVSPDGKQLAVLCYTVSGSEVRFFNLSRTEQQGAFAVSDTVLLDVRWLSSSRLCAYSTDAAFFLDSGGQWLDTYSFEGQYLNGCTFGGDSGVVFSLSPYRAGTASVLVSLDQNGRLLGSADMQSEIVSLTASGSEILVLCPDSAILFNSTLSEKGRLTGLTGFKYGLLRSRGEALFISANYAEVYAFG